MSTFHSVVLSNLWPNVTYYYTVVSSDAAGNTSRSPEMMFRLQAVDVTPPTVSVRINRRAAGDVHHGAAGGIRFRRSAWRPRDGHRGRPYRLHQLDAVFGIHVLALLI